MRSAGTLTETRVAIADVDVLSSRDAIPMGEQRNSAECRLVRVRDAGDSGARSLCARARSGYSGRRTLGSSARLACSDARQPCSGSVNGCSDAQRVGSGRRQVGASVRSGGATVRSDYSGRRHVCSSGRSVCSGHRVACASDRSRRASVRYGRTATRLAFLVSRRLVRRDGKLDSIGTLILLMNTDCFLPRSNQCPISTISVPS